MHHAVLLPRGSLLPLPGPLLGRRYRRADRARRDAHHQLRDAGQILRQGRCRHPALDATPARRDPGRCRDLARVRHRSGLGAVPTSAGRRRARAALLHAEQGAAHRGDCRPAGPVAATALFADAAHVGREGPIQPFDIVDDALQGGDAPAQVGIGVPVGHVAEGLDLAKDALADGFPGIPQDRQLAGSRLADIG